VLGLLLAFGGPVAADIYRYQDKEGVWHFTNVEKGGSYRLFIRTSRKDASEYIKVYEDEINRASKQFGVDAPLIKAVIKAESDFDQHAVSNKGAQGLMQLMPGTSDAMEVDDPFDARDNIHGGTRYLSLMLGRFKNDMRLALAAYNAGPERVAEFHGIPPYQETRTFIERVLSYYRQFNSSSK